MSSRTEEVGCHWDPAHGQQLLPSAKSASQDENSLRVPVPEEFVVVSCRPKNDVAHHRDQKNWNELGVCHSQTPPQREGRHKSVGSLILMAPFDPDSGLDLAVANRWASEEALEVVEGDGRIRRRHPNHHLHNRRWEPGPISWSSADLHLLDRIWHCSRRHSYESLAAPDCWRPGKEDSPYFCAGSLSKLSKPVLMKGLAIVAKLTGGSCQISPSIIIIKIEHLDMK